MKTYNEIEILQIVRTAVDETIFELEEDGKTDDKGARVALTVERNVTKMMNTREKMYTREDAASAVNRITADMIRGCENKEKRIGMSVLASAIVTEFSQEVEE